MYDAMTAIDMKYMLITLCIGAITGIVLTMLTREKVWGDYLLYFLLTAGVAFPLVCLFFVGLLSTQVEIYLYFCMGAAMPNLVVGCAIDLGRRLKLFNS